MLLSKSVKSPRKELMIEGLKPMIGITNKFRDSKISINKHRIIDPFIKFVVYQGKLYRYTQLYNLVS